MTSGMNKALALLPLIAALAACGGGGDGGSADPAAVANASSAPATGDAGNAGSGATATPAAVKTAYEKGASPRYKFLGVGVQSSGRLDAVEQLADGSVVTINAMTLTGTVRKVEEIAGDQTFAIGRWSKGTATTSGGTSLLESSVNDAYHYVVYNAPAAFPANASYKCDEGRFTAPNQNNGASNVYFARSTGTATLGFEAGSAMVSVWITTTAGSEQGTLSVPLRSIETPATTAITDKFFAGGEGMSLSIADAGANKLHIVAAYQSKAGAGTYLGVGVFTCTAQ